MKLWTIIGYIMSLLVLFYVVLKNPNLEGYGGGTHHGITHHGITHHGMGTSGGGGYYSYNPIYLEDYIEYDTQPFYYPTGINKRYFTDDYV